MNSGAAADPILKQAYLVVPRLEKLTPDSSFAHQASGCRRAILRLSRRIQSNNHPLTLATDRETLHLALHQAFEILEKAAQERIR
jgi:hypothetical protein